MSPKRPHLLLVDDQPANLLVLEAVLQDVEADLVRATSGEEALLRLRQQDFAAVLLDVRMPGMTGLEAAKIIRAQPRTKGTPIIFLTAGDDTRQALAEAYALGAVDFLAKPVVPAVLRAKVGVFVELYRSREELRAGRDARLRLATEASGLGVWTWEPEADRATWEHEGIYDMFGLPRGSEAPNARRLQAEFVHPQDRPAFQAAVQATVERGEPFFLACRILRRPDRAIRWLEFRGRLQPATAQQPRQVLGTIADITDRKDVEQRLSASEERYRTLFESIDEGFCLIEMLYDSDGKPVDYRFLEANSAFEEHTGLKDAIGRTVRELVPDLDRHWFDIYARVAENGEPVRFIDEAKAMHRWFDVYATRLGGPDSRRVALLFSDITARRKSEQDLRRLADELALADRRKTEFLATLAHELRNPLAPLSNGLHLMRVASGKPEVVEKTRQMMERQVNHMVHLVDDLLDIARVSTGKLALRKQRVVLQQVVGTALETSASLVEASQHKLSVSLPEEPLELEADPTRLAQVVSNLLNNAAKYTPAAGRIALEVRREGGEAVLTVSDTGIGIPAESLGSVFDMFAQVAVSQGRPHGGLGIGLSLVQNLVQLHGGSVGATSAGPGEGSTFTVRLPLADVQPAMAATGTAGVAAAAGEPQGLRVLVVDDNQDAADSLAALLEMDGHETHVAHDGGQALRMAQEFTPELVFLDIGLPDMSGYDVARRLRERPELAATVLVALTGWGTQEDRARSRDAGFDHHLTKPAELAAVEKLMGSLRDRLRA